MTNKEHLKEIKEQDNETIKTAASLNQTETFWLNLKKTFLEEMYDERWNQDQRLKRLYQTLSKTNIVNTRNGELIGSRRFSGMAHFHTWRKKGIEAFSEGFGRVPITIVGEFYTQTFLAHPAEFNLIYDYLRESCPRVESWHGLFHGLPKTTKHKDRA
jgi:hypothetical protein